MSLKPRTLKYADALQAIEQRIVDALPEIVDGLIARAKDGDAKAAVYLCDRILGRTTGRRWHRPTIAKRLTPKPPSSLTSKSGKRTTKCGGSSPDSGRSAERSTLAMVTIPEGVRSHADCPSRSRMVNRVN